VTDIELPQWYIAIVREESIRYVNSMPLNMRTQIQAKGQSTDGYFGFFWFEVGYPSGPSFDMMTLGAAALLEFSALERIMRRAFPIA
jgi:hypothetical protein